MSPCQDVIMNLLLDSFGLPFCLKFEISSVEHISRVILGSKKNLNIMSISARLSAASTLFFGGKL